MERFAKAFRDEISGKTPDSQICLRTNVRISILTSRLVRVETHPDGKFCDMPTQTVLNRNFATPSFYVKENRSDIEIRTDNYIDEDIKEDSKLLTLSTCTFETSDARLLVVAVLDEK